MMKKTLKSLTDLMYRTKRTRRKFELDNPDEVVLAADASKGIIATDHNLQRGPQWITSQRAVILLTDKRIICGKWTIPLDTISFASLLTYGTGQVLMLETNTGEKYQFGMQYNPEWESQQVLSLAFGKVKAKYSLFSIVVRVILVSSFICWLCLRLIEN